MPMKQQTLATNIGRLQDLESKNPALSRVLSSKGASVQLVASSVKTNDAADTSLPSASDGGSLQSEKSNP